MKSHWIACPITLQVTFVLKLLVFFLFIHSFIMRQYHWSEDGSTIPAATALHALAKERLPAALEAKFAEFPVAIIEKHGKDLTISGEPSRTGTPAPTSAPVAASGPAASSVPTPAKPAGVTKSAHNTSKIVKEATFMAAADDLFGLLTDAQRIPLWTRASAEVGQLTTSRTGLKRLFGTSSQQPRLIHHTRFLVGA